MPPVSREPLIGLMTDPGPRLAVGLLGILKSGGAFVPLHPAQPEERLRFMIADCGIEVLVTEARYLALALRVGEAAGCLRKVACLDDPGELPPLPAGIEVRTLAGFVPRKAPAAAELPAESLAYVIYTSGSTGLPKGVGVSHASAVPMLLWSRDGFALDARTRVLQSLSYAFDFGAWEILSTLVSGGALHTLEPGETGDPVAYGRRAVAAGIDVVHATPSFFRAVAETGVRLEGLRVLHLGGEALSRAQVERLAAAVGPDCVLYNGYGPTEATVNSLIFAVGRPGGLRGAERVPIGRPSADNAVYVLDRRGGAGAGGSSGRALGGRSRGGARVSRPSGADGGEVRAGRLLRGGGVPPVPDGGSGALAAGRGRGVPRPGGPPGEDPGVPRRAGGDRGGAAPSPGSAGCGGGGAGAAGWCGAGGLGGVRGGGPGDRTSCASTCAPGCPSR